MIGNFIFLFVHYEHSCQLFDFHFALAWQRPLLPLTGEDGARVLFSRVAQASKVYYFRLITCGAK